MMELLLLAIMIIPALLFPACLINAIVHGIKGEDKVKASNSKIGACVSFAAVVLLLILLIDG